MQSQVFDRCTSRYDSLVDTNWGALSFTEGECYVCGFVFVGLHSSFLEPVFNAMQMVLEIEGGRCRIGVRTQSYDSVHTSHSSAQNEYKLCVPCVKMHRRHSAQASDVSPTHEQRKPLACLWFQHQCLVHTVARVQALFSLLVGTATLSHRYNRSFGLVR